MIENTCICWMFDDSKFIACCQLHLAVRVLVRRISSEKFLLLQLCFLLPSSYQLFSSKENKHLQYNCTSLLSLDILESRLNLQTYHGQWISPKLKSQVRIIQIHINTFLMSQVELNSQCLVKSAGRLNTPWHFASPVSGTGQLVGWNVDVEMTDLALSRIYCFGIPPLWVCRLVM